MSEASAAFREHLRLLIHGDAEQRDDACFALGKARDPRAINPIVESLRSNRVSCGTAAWAIGSIGRRRSVTVLRDLAHREDCRRAALKALVDLATAALHPEEARRLQWDPGRRAACHAALACLVRLVARDPQTIRSLLEIVDGPRTPQAEGAVAILLRASRPAIAALLPLLRSDDKPARKLAAQALSAAGWIPTNTVDGAIFLVARGNWDACKAMGSLAVEPLIAALQDDDVAAAGRNAIVKTLGHLADDRALPAVLAALEDEALRTSAVEALGRLGGPAASQALNALVKTRGRQSERGAALIALVRLGDAHAVDELSGFLADCPSHLRREVESALAEGGAPIVRALRAMLLPDRRPAAASAAARALGALRDAASVAPLISLLEHEDRSVVESAAYALGQIRDARALDPLIRLMEVAAEAVESDDLLPRFPLAHGLLQQHSPQTIAAWALAELGDAAAVAPLRTALKSAPSFARPALAVALARLDPRSAAEVLGLGPGGKPAWDDDRDDRLTRELWRLGAVAIEPLAVALRESMRRDVVVRLGRSFESVVFSLGRTRDEAAVAPLSQALQKCERHQRRLVFSALAEIGAPAVSELIKFLDDPDPDVSEAAARALGTIGGAEAVAMLCDFRPGHESPGRALSAVQALRTLRDPAAAPFLLDILERWKVPVDDRKILHGALLRAGLNPSNGIRYEKPERERDAAINKLRLEAACSLAESGVPGAAEPLIAALEHEEPEVRRRAAAALAGGAGGGAVKQLAARIFDWNPEVRGAAAESLGTLQDPRGVGALRIALTDRHHEVRKAAAAALDALSWRPRTRREQADFLIAKQDWGGCAALGTSAVDALTARLDDEAPSIQHAAVEALAACGGPASAEPLRALLGDERRPELRAAAMDAIARCRRTELAADVAASVVAACVGRTFRSASVPNEHQPIVAAGIRAAQALHIQLPADLLTGVLESADRETAALTASLLARSGDPGAIPPLVACLNDEAAAVEVRAAAAEALGRFAGATAFDALVARLCDPNQHLQAAARHALAACADETTIGLFLWKLHMGPCDEETGKSIRAALASFAGIPPDQLLKNRESTLHEVVKRAAQRRLRQHSPAAALACYTNALATYTEQIGALAGDEEHRAFEPAARFALVLSRDGTELFVEAGNARAAGEIARSAIELARVAANHKKVWSALNLVCAALARAGDDRITLEIHEKAVRLIESMWFLLPAEEVGLRGFFSDKAAIYDGLALCYQRLGATAQAWETLETAKARYLSDLIVRRQAAPVESYSQVEDIVWSPVRRASADAASSDGAPSSESRELVGIEPAGAEQDATVIEPERRRAFAEFLKNTESRWRLALVDDLWDAMAAWIGNPLAPSMREAFRPLRGCVHDLLHRRPGGNAMTPDRFADNIERSREALSALSRLGTIQAPFGSLADYLPGLRERARAFPPHPQGLTLELQAMLEVLDVICGEGTARVTTRARTSNDPPATWRGVFRQQGSAQPRKRRVHEASRRLDAAWEGFSETNWRYVTRVARGEPTSFARLRAMLEYDAAHAIVALQVTAHGTVAYLFRGVLRDDQRRALPGQSDALWSDVLTFHSWTLDRVQELIASGWLEPLRALGTEPADAYVEAAARRVMSETLGRVYGDVLAPIVRRLQRWGIRRITFIPTRGLNVLPLHACWHRSEGRTRYLADQFEVAYAPSATLLEICRARSDTRVPCPPQLYAWSSAVDDLPFAQAEVANVARLFPGPAGVANPAAGDDHAGAATATHIHFACHGDYDWNDPLASGLQLGEHRRLRLADLFEDAFPIGNASLVVLSACETGLADPADLADEYLGLTAGFLFAGAPAVVSTLWPVDDLAAMLLMERLYRLHLHQRMSAAGALRQAQAWLRKMTAESVCSRLTLELKRFTTSGKPSPREEIVRSEHHAFSKLEPRARPFDDPYYWGAFTMNGI